MERSLWFDPSIFKQKILSTTHGGTELVVVDGRFNRIPLTKRWVGWFLSDVEPNYSWNLVLHHLRKEWEAIQEIDPKNFDLLKNNLETALKISDEYQQNPLLKFLSGWSDSYEIDTEWIKDALAKVSAAEEAYRLQKEKQGIVRNLINSFSVKDIEAPGIFRVSSPKAEVEKWSKALLDSPNADISELSPLLRATLLKNFLKKLVLFRNDQNFIAAGDTEVTSWERLNRLMLAVQNLPEDNRQILQMVLPLLKKVADFKENNINSKNLGVCMGQDMLSLEEEDDLKKLAYSNEALSLLIENQEKILSKG